MFTICLNLIILALARAGRELRPQVGYPQAGEGVGHAASGSVEVSFLFLLALFKQKNATFSLSRFRDLVESEAFDLSCHEPAVQEQILPLTFTHTFEKFDNFEAYLVRDESHHILIKKRQF